MEAWLKSLFTSILVLLIVVIILKISFLYLTPFIIAIILAAFINPAVKNLRHILDWTGPLPYLLY